MLFTPSMTKIGKYTYIDSIRVAEVSNEKELYLPLKYIIILSGKNNPAEVRLFSPITKLRKLFKIAPFDNSSIMVSPFREPFSFKQIS